MADDQKDVSEGLGGDAPAIREALGLEPGAPITEADCLQYRRQCLGLDDDTSEEEVDRVGDLDLEEWRKWYRSLKLRDEETV
jgi:hypothetical protein